jgi:hypothetical protein
MATTFPRCRANHCTYVRFKYESETTDPCSPQAQTRREEALRAVAERIEHERQERTARGLKDGDL